MKITPDQTANLVSFVRSEEFDIFRRYADEYKANLDSQIDNALDASVSSVLKREQLLGGRKHLRYLFADFCNFVETNNKNQETEN